MFKFRRVFTLMLVGLLAMLAILAMGSSDEVVADKTEYSLPSFRMPYPRDMNEHVHWSGGPHQYGNTNDIALVPIGSGSGLDFAGDDGYKDFQVLAMSPGTVLYNGYGVFGYQVAIKHDDGGTVMVYGHLDDSQPQPGLKTGDHVVRGEPIGRAGNSGEQPSVHLHIELRDGSDSCCSTGHIGGKPIGWHGREIDGWVFFEYRDNSEDAATAMYNYDGVAIRSSVTNIGEAVGYFYVDAARSRIRYLYTALPWGFVCASSPCDAEPDQGDVRFSGGGHFGGGAVLSSTNEIVGDDPDPTSTPAPTITPTDEPVYGDSRVDIREHAGCTGGQYGWDEATKGIFNVPDYMNDRTSCIDVQFGKSIAVYEHADGQGGWKCFNNHVDNLEHATYNTGANMNDTISSVQVFDDTTCGGQMSMGLEPGDTVTIHVGVNFTDTHWGVHDVDWWNIPDYTQNQVSSIGVENGWSGIFYENQNRWGGVFCLTASDWDLTDNVFDNGHRADNNIESMQVFHDSNCGGWSPVTPTATVTKTLVPSKTPTPTQSATATATEYPVGTGTGLMGAYYNGTEFDSFVLSRVDPVLNMDTLGSPATGVEADNFSARWTGKFQTLFSEVCSVCTISDDGVRVWIDGVLLIDNWTDHSATKDCIVMGSTAGQYYDITIEYYERRGNAILKLVWSSEHIAEQIIPMTQLYPGELEEATPTPIPSNTPIPTEEPFDSGMITNGGFEDLGDGGWPVGWYSDGGVVVDMNSQGNQGTNSMHFVPPADGYTNEVFLRSQAFYVTPGMAYQWSQYVRTLSAEGAVSFRINEYDIDAVYMSSQTYGPIYGEFDGTWLLDYVPSSDEVAAISVEYYKGQGDLAHTFIDSVSMEEIGDVPEIPVVLSLYLWRVGDSLTVDIEGCIDGVADDTYSLLDTGDGWYDNTIQGNACFEVSHEYQEYGTYTVTLTAQTPDGDETVEETIELLEPQMDLIVPTPVPTAKAISTIAPTAPVQKQKPDSTPVGPPLAATELVR